MVLPLSVVVVGKVLLKQALNLNIGRECRPHILRTGVGERELLEDRGGKPG